MEVRSNTRKEIRIANRKSIIDVIDFSNLLCRQQSKKKKFIWSTYQIILPIGLTNDKVVEILLALQLILTTVQSVSTNVQSVVSMVTVPWLPQTLYSSSAAALLSANVTLQPVTLYAVRGRVASSFYCYPTPNCVQGHGLAQ